ncbi:MAG: hypothetical protein ACRCTS_01420 [Fusobacteriaceae bacterium]
MEKKITLLNSDFKNVDFINHNYINSLLDNFNKIEDKEILEVLDKARKREKITPEDMLVLLATKKKEHLPSYCTACYRSGRTSASPMPL